MVKETGTNRGTWGKDHRRLSGKTGGCSQSDSVYVSTHLSFLHLKKMRRILSCPAECFCTIRLQTIASASEPSMLCEVHASYIHVHQNLNLLATGSQTGREAIYTPWLCQCPAPVHAHAHIPTGHLRQLLSENLKPRKK